MFRNWLLRAFLALLLLDGVLLLCGVKFAVLAAIHALSGFFPLWVLAFFYWVKNGLECHWSWSQEQKNEYITASLPYVLFYFVNLVVFAAFAIVDSRVPRPRPALPALNCPAPAAPASGKQGESC